MLHLRDAYVLVNCIFTTPDPRPSICPICYNRMVVLMAKIKEKGEGDVFWQLFLVSFLEICSFDLCSVVFHVFWPFQVKTGRTSCLPTYISFESSPDKKSFPSLSKIPVFYFERFGRVSELLNMPHNKYFLLKLKYKLHLTECS